MKEDRFSEKESLELISRMLRQTRQNMEVGSGNIFLCYGYSAFAISVIVFLSVYSTADPRWAFVWFLMFVPGIVIRIRHAKEKPQAITYMDKAIANTWSVVGVLFTLTLIAILILGRHTGGYDFILMLPLSLLYAGIGTSITGVITRLKALIYLPLIALFVSIYMLTELISGGEATAFWHLYFGAAFVFMMIVPGHLINRKSIRQCSRN